MTQEQTDGRDAEGRIHGKGCGASMASPSATVPAPALFTNLEAPRTPYLWDFMEASSLGQEP